MASRGPARATTHAAALHGGGGAQHGPLGDPATLEPDPGAVHMFCVPDDDPLLGARSAGLEPSATASALAHGLAGCRYDFVLTSDI